MSNWTTTTREEVIEAFRRFHKRVEAMRSANVERHPAPPQSDEPNLVPSDHRGDRRGRPAFRRRKILEMINQDPGSLWFDPNDSRGPLQYLPTHLNESRLKWLQKIAPIKGIESLTGADVVIVTAWDSRSGVRFRCATPSKERGYEFSSGPEALKKAKLIVTWGPMAQYLGEIYAPVVDVLRLAQTVWGPRLGKLTVAVAERQILKTPAPPYPCNEDERELMVTGAVLVPLLYAAHKPGVLEDWLNIAGLGLLAARAGNVELASHCLTLIRRVVPRPLEFRLARAVVQLRRDRGWRGPRVKHGTPAEARKMLIKRRKSLYGFVQLEEHLRTKYQGPRPGVKVRKNTQLRWGLNSSMREVHVAAVLAEQHQVSMDLVKQVFDLLVVSDELGVGLHNAYYKDLLHNKKPTRQEDADDKAHEASLIVKPRWRADAHGKDARRVHHSFTIKHLAEHFLHRGRWRGYEPATDRLMSREKNPEYDLELELQGRAYEYLIYKLARPWTRVLIIDLDNHGGEATDVLTRYKIVIKHLPGAIIYQSSKSGGLHLIYFLPEPVPAFELYCRILDLLGEDREIIGSRGAEIIPTMAGKGNVRLPEGMESVLLNENLEPLLQNRSMGERLRHLLDCAEEQRNVLQYLLERAPEQERLLVEAKRPPRTKLVVKKPREVQAPRPRQRNYPTTARPAPSAFPAPQLIFEGEETYRSAHRIAGRALWEMWKRKIVRSEDDMEKAQAHMNLWMSDPINAAMSERLSATEGVALSRRDDLNGALTFLWPLFMEQRLGWVQEQGGRGWDAWPPLGDEDARRVELFVESYHKHHPLDELQAHKLFEGLSKIFSMIVHVKPDKDGRKVVFLRKQDLCKQCYLHKSKSASWREQPLYYKAVLEFLEVRGVLKRLTRPDSGSQSYEAIWPPRP